MTTLSNRFLANFAAPIVLGRGVIKPNQMTKRTRQVTRTIGCAAFAIAALISSQCFAAKLTVDDGVVIKFGADAGMTVRQGLQTNRHVVLTSVYDDSVAGQTGTAAGVPAPSDWRGLKIEDSVTVANLQLNGLTIRYAGKDAAAALEIAQNYAIQFLKISDSLLGIRAVGGAHPTFSGLSLVANGVGLESREDSLPTLTGSEVTGNGDFGVLNLSPQTIVQAAGTWWGAASGPTEPVGNPVGAGDKVSAGVNYGSFSTTIPLIDCSLAIADGNATVAQPSATLALECRNAVEYRLALSNNFGSTLYQPIAATATFPLSGAAGDRQIYVEYRTTTLNTTTASVVVHYQPGTPVVTIDTPAAGAVITTDTTIAATASDAAGIDHVDFYVDATLLGTDTIPPYDVSWPIAGFATGSHTIKVIATSTSSQTGQATRTVTVQPPVGGDTEGPLIDDVMFDAESVTNGMTLTASGTLTFSVSDPSAVNSVSVLLDDTILPNGELDGTEYSVAVDLDDVLDGSHTLTIEAADGVGNSSERVFDVVVDTAISPTAPTVTITAPQANAQITADTTIAASVTGSNISHVDFYADSTPIGSDTSPPYEVLWQVGGVANGTHTLKAIATNSSNQTGQDTQTVTVQHPASDATGPSITNALFAGQTLTEGAMLTASGTLTFSVTDLSGVQSAGVLFDNQPVAGGTLSGATYSVALNLDGIGDGAHTIKLQASDPIPNTSELSFDVIVNTTTSPGAPTVTITAPAANAQIAVDTPIAAAVTGANISRVDFYVDTAWIGGATAPAPYQVLWQIAADFPNGWHTLQAIATNANNQTGEASIQVNLQRVSNDTTGPTISDIYFRSQSLGDDAVLTAPGLLTFKVADDSGVASGAVLIDTTSITGGGLNNGQYSTLLDFATVPNGTHTITLRATDRVGNSTDRILQNITVNIPPPPTPTILVPANPTQTPQPTIAVSGTAQVGSTIKLYLNGSAVAGQLTTEFNGSFHGTVTLPTENTYGLTATAETGRGISAPTAPVSITYLAPSSSVAITSPPADAVIDVNGAVAIDASVVDAVGIDNVKLKIDGQAFGAPLSTAPYTWSWNIDDAVAEGEHQFEVTALNVVGKSTTVTRSVSVQHTPPPPPPVQTAYTGLVQSVTPESSYGDVPITIAGSAIDTTTGAVVPNALLKIVLQVNGFQRRINTSTNASGAFSYRFVPQNSDAGNYVVSVIHPDQTDLPDQGHFTINRLGLSPTQYALQAARTVPSAITITASASAGEGANGVYLAAIPADQPSGSLPPGITIDSPAPVNVSAGGSVPINVTFTAGDQTVAPATTGTVVLTAKDGAGHSRGLVTINYTLSEPQAYLFPRPSSVQTGVKRDQQVSETVQVTNRGLLPAHNVRAELIEFTNPQNVVTDLPAWVYLASPAAIGDLAIGASTAIQIVAAPTSDVAGGIYVPDGIYKVKIHVTADGIDGFVWVSIAVTSSETGGLLFLAKDIYTCLPDCVTTPGLANASIRVQNEAVYTLTDSAITNAQGEAEILNLPTGHYRYVANALSHVSTTGRFTVRPGISVTQEVFLDYELVTFEWSVTETTIQDHYDVTLTATYETQVPAPVMLIQPASINLPDMQEGEELTGEVTITNYGLVRADNVVWSPSVSDQYFQIEYLGTPPDTFDARQSFRLPYRVTKKCTPLPGTDGDTSCPPNGAQASALFRSVKSGSATTSGTCYGYRNPMNIAFGYQCAAGDQRSGAAAASFNKAYGQNCGGSGGGGGGGGGAGGGWGGGGGGGPVGTAMSGGPGCVPICPDCNGGGPGG